MAKPNDGAPGIDGVTLAAIEESGVEGFREQIRQELVSHTDRPLRSRKKEIPQDARKSGFFRFHGSGTGWSRER